jgi:hypothetical protein
LAVSQLLQQGTEAARQLQLAGCFRWALGLGDGDVGGGWDVDIKMIGPWVLGNLMTMTTAREPGAVSLVCESAPFTIHHGPGQCAWMLVASCCQRHLTVHAPTFPLVPH